MDKNTTTDQPSSGDSDNHLLLIDGYGFVFRAYHSLPPLTRPDGTPVGAVYGFTNMLIKLLTERKGSHIAVVLDAGRQNFRHTMYSEYKANRPEAPEDLKPQFPLIREAALAFGLPVVELEGFEADDIIATYVRLAKEAGTRVTIISSDKDLMQLVCETVSMFDPMKSRMIGIAEVQEKFGVPPEKVRDVLAMMGDSSDNIPGIRGIGPKTAAELINQFGDLNGVLSNTAAIKQQKRREMIESEAELARLSHQLVGLHDQAPLGLGLEQLVRQPQEAEKLLGFIQQYGFKALTARAAALAGGKTSSQLFAPPAGEVRTEQVLAQAVQTITDKAALAAWLELAKHTGEVSVQLYTNPLSKELAGLALAYGHAQYGGARMHIVSAYVPVSRTLPSGDLFTADKEKTPGLSKGELWEVMRPYLLDPALLKITHDAKNFIKWCREQGVTPTPLDDVMLMSYSVDAGLGSHEFLPLILRHLGHELAEIKSLLGSGKTAVSLSEVELPAMLAYAAPRAEHLLALHRLLKRRMVMEKVFRVYMRDEQPLSYVLAEMETSGILVDSGILAQLSQEFSARLETLQEEIYQLAGCSFNIGSPKQLGEVLFEHLGLPGGSKSGKSGTYTTDAEVLEELVLAGHNIAEKLLEWRQLSKLKNTYTEGLAKEISSKTGRIHTHFSMAVTSTGRLSSTEPNLQNIPIRTEEGTKIRRAFIAKPGCKLVSADYSQIELRLLAHVANISSLKQAFKEGKDIHAITSSQIFNIPLEEIDSTIRRKAKAINFGIIYGISSFGLARQLGIGRAEAGRYIEAYFKEYPGIQHYMEVTKEFARAHGYVTTIFGRKCHIPAIKEKNGALRSFGERAAINAPLQGAAADIIKKAMIALDKRFKEIGTSARMVLQVHDELLFEVPEEETQQLVPLIRNIMEQVVHLDVPLLVGVGVGDNWAAIH